MLSARAIYREILDHDETCALFLSVASSGEAQGGWENARIAELTRDATLRAKIVRHGLDEDKHGRLFDAVLRRRGLEAVAVPDGANYTMLLERAGIGLSHARLAEDRSLDDEELLLYLVHSRVTEQRAFEEVAMQRRLLAGDPTLGKPLRIIAEDEENHLDYCHAELLRFAQQGHRPRIHELLREYARVEIRTYREVSLAVLRRMGEALAWPRSKRWLLATGIHVIYAWERAWGWRRMTTLRAPHRQDPLGAAQTA